AQSDSWQCPPVREGLVGTPEFVSDRSCRNTGLGACLVETSCGSPASATMSHLLQSEHTAGHSLFDSSPVPRSPHSRQLAVQRRAKAPADPGRRPGPYGLQPPHTHAPRSPESCRLGSARPTPIALSAPPAKRKLPGDEMVKLALRKGLWSAAHCAASPGYTNQRQQPPRRAIRLPL